MERLRELVRSAPLLAVALSAVVSVSVGVGIGRWSARAAAQSNASARATATDGSVVDFLKADRARQNAQMNFGGN